ncbi:methyltransferase [Sphingomonas arenae]|uniref:methyltransferase n=1 Tax=Sphingomonas arenae TaxID=2812555 RepID=UPI001967AA6A|nr:methyltransferase [Sphingomonas arenae]
MDDGTSRDDRHQALVALLKTLDDVGYSFTAITPASHARILGRRGNEPARDLRDVFGWSLPFKPDLLPEPIHRCLQEAELLEEDGGLCRSRVRVAELGGRLFLHSAFPTTEDNSVFFGPDTYRFVRFLEQTLDGRAVRQLVDMGAGSGVGGVSASALVEAEQVTLVDTNPLANVFAAANAEIAGVDLSIVAARSLESVEGPIDCVIANPPFIIDDLGRTYRDGGHALGTAVAARWAREAMQRLEVGGTLLLYTGSPVVGGDDLLLQTLSADADEFDCTLRYEEIDPDIFGEELEKPAYADAGVERIAAVGALVTRS